MKRREFVAALASAGGWPAIGWAQQSARMRRIGLLMYADQNDPEYEARLSGFNQGLAELGWTDGRNLQLDIRWSGANVDRVRMHAKELVDLQPDVLVATSTSATAAFQRETRTIPIVFVGISDPVGAGFVTSLPRPGGNLTGFINIEAGLGGKWLQLLLEIAPGVKRAAIMFSPDTATGSYYVPSFETAARSLNVVPIAAPVRSEAEIEMAIASLGRELGGGLVFPPDGFTGVHRALILRLAARHNIPTVFSGSIYPKSGGLLSYGPDGMDIFRRSASYVDRILRGEKPADLPIQLPSKFELVINLGTAKALGLTVPLPLIASADDLIQ